MRVPLSWLAEFVDLDDSIERLADRLTMAGLAVESVEEVGTIDSRVRVGRLAQVEPHPDADRLRVCRVELGDGQVQTVVSGAPGLRVGRVVPVALPGARLAGGLEVAARELRGVASHGMLCSEAELGVSDDRSGLMAVPRGTAVGTRLAELRGMRDTVLELDVTPNRGDCLSILGVAREVVAVTGARLRVTRPRLREIGEPTAEAARVRIEAPELCPRYCARIVREVRHRPSPLWLRLRLERAGMRPIDAIVDATNYVMLELGQPLHAFDFDRIAEGTIIVRRARVDEQIATLDDSERRLDAEDLVIADPDGPVAIAGVMGGARSEVRPDTTTLLLESAFFAPATVRRTARRLGLVSQAAYRFERRVDPNGVAVALDRAAALIGRLTGGRVAPGVVDEAPGADTLEAPTIELRTARAVAALGMAMEPAEIRRRLRAIGAACRGQGRRLSVVPPSYRGDLRAEEDLVEELARVGGYDTIPVTVPRVEIQGVTDTPARLGAAHLRRLLVADGLSETVSPPFVPSDLDDLVPGEVGGPLDPLAIRNPLSSETTRLRRSPLSTALRILRLNLDRGAEYVGLFEIGKRYGLAADGARVERPVVSLLLAGYWPPCGVERQGPPVGFDDLKGVVENLLAGVGADATEIEWAPTDHVHFLHPGKAAQVRIGDHPIGVIGILHPNVAQVLDLPRETAVGEIGFTEVAHHRSALVRIRPLPRYPAVARDIAVVVDDDFRAHAIVDEVRTLNHPLIESVRLFDCYRGEPIAAGKKSLAYAISYRAADRTLTDDEVNAAHDELRKRLQTRFELALRS